jgi:Amt family ammonium transporter
LIAGVIVYFSVVFFDRVRVDDPVGAVSVHLVCGIWGTLAVGIFGAKAGAGQLVTQIIGVVSYGVVCVVASLIFFGVIKSVMGLRVSEEEEVEGLDQGEHGMPAYSDFVSSTSSR